MIRIPARHARYVVEILRAVLAHGIPISPSEIPTRENDS